MKIDFEFDTPYGKFRDALHLPDNHGLTQAQIDALQQERLNNWLDAVQNPPAPAPEFVEINGVRYEKVAYEGQTFLKPVGA